jgi:hypothetical protein
MQSFAQLGGDKLEVNQEKTTPRVVGGRTAPTLHLAVGLHWSRTGPDQMMSGALGRGA